MFSLFTLRFTHYSQKDSKTGIITYLIAHNDDEVVEYVDQNYAIVKDDQNDQSEGVTYLEAEDVETQPELLRSAEALGLSVDKSLIDMIEISGLSHLLTRWNKGDDWKDPSDLYYGATFYHWREVKQISQHELDVLHKLGIAKDIRRLDQEVDVL